MNQTSIAHHNHNVTGFFPLPTFLPYGLEEGRQGPRRRERRHSGRPRRTALGGHAHVQGFHVRVARILAVATAAAGKVHALVGAATLPDGSNLTGGSSRGVGVFATLVHESAGGVHGIGGRARGGFGVLLGGNRNQDGGNPNKGGGTEDHRDWWCTGIAGGLVNCRCNKEEVKSPMVWDMCLSVERSFFGYSLRVNPKVKRAFARGITIVQTSNKYLLWNRCRRILKSVPVWRAMWISTEIILSSARRMRSFTGQRSRDSMRKNRA